MTANNATFQRTVHKRRSLRNLTHFVSYSSFTWVLHGLITYCLLVFGYLTSGKFAKPGKLLILGLVTRSLHSNFSCSLPSNQQSPDKQAEVGYLPRPTASAAIRLGNIIAQWIPLPLFTSFPHSFHLHHRHGKEEHFHVIPSG